MTIIKLERLIESSEILLQKYIQACKDNTVLMQSEHSLKLECQQLREKNASIVARMKALVEQFKVLKRD